MSGIVGIFYLDGRTVETTDLERMVESITHRGSDGSGAWHKGTVGLGHRMLWTTPESLLEQLPMVNPTKDIVLTADARIDNREELISALALKDRPTGEISDSQLILSAYEKWGENCPEKLIGDFVFALWDERRGKLFCARDHIGTKPFYYFHSNNTFVFASEIKALLILNEVPRRLNELRVADHLVRIFEDITSTFYQEIYRLPAAHCMTVDREGVNQRSYWSLDPSHEIRLRSDDEYAEAFHEVFTEAVRCRLRSDFPIGSALSGGLDSSSIACTARNLLAVKRNQALHTFSAIFPSLPEGDLRKIDERNFIEAVVAKGGFLPHYVHADRLSPLLDIDRALWHQDETFLAPNLYMHWGLYRSAHEHGVRVLLDGIDGDTTVSHGLEKLTDLARSGRWKTLINEAISISQKPNASVRPRKIIWMYGIKPLVPASIVKIWQILRSYKQPVWAVNTAIHPDFAQRIDMDNRVHKLLHNNSTQVRTARENHLYNLKSPLIPISLEILDKASAAFSLEARYPFFDRRLMEFCLALPPEQKLSQGWPRIILRHAMQGILPREVQWRFTKANLNPNFRRRLLDFERDTLDRMILIEPQAIEPYFDLPALKTMYNRYKSQPLISEADVLTVYGAVVLALWLRSTTF
ncbi:MAG TPA: lasso peptide isopeptide bond-forming cyclase [bacterium]|nr:lasso peptide isopeptide bond-forming cyclase [bacterium]